MTTPNDPETPIEAPKEPKNWRYYVHLANGDVRKFSQKMLDNLHAPHLLRENGIEHQIIGVHPREVEFKEETSDDDE